MKTTKMIRKRLLARRTDLLERYRGNRERADEELDSHESEEIEHATELWDARVLSSLGDADTRMLSEIVDAIRRLDAGTYGTCLACGGAISAPRLSAIPEAATCFDCATTAQVATINRFARPG